MDYNELKASCDLLNRKFIRKTLPGTEWRVRDFIIMPDANNTELHKSYSYAIEIGIKTDKIEDSIKNLPGLEIRIRLRDKEMPGFYFPKDFGLTIEFLENYMF
jgi:hypothetical protein